MEQLRQYRTFTSDSTRWGEFRFRPGDIVISTPAKSGTTWMQTLCAMLIFDSVDLPDRLASLSPWFDMNLHGTDDVVERLEAQQHRRFIKTHTPLDGIPYDERVTYICVGRDPRDVAISSAHHMQNINLDVLFAARAAAVGLDDLASMGEPPPDVSADPSAFFRFWIETDDDSYMISTLSSVMHHLDTAWERRDAGNVALFHYGDLSADLPGELRRLAAVLDIDVDADRLARFAEAAQFARMKSRADALVPNAEEAIWHSNEAFFRRGGSGDWRGLLEDADLTRYEQRMAALAPAGLAQWAHDGRAADVLPQPGGQPFRLQSQASGSDSRP